MIIDIVKKNTSNIKTHFRVDGNEKFVVFGYNIRIHARFKEGICAVKKFCYFFKVDKAVRKKTSNKMINVSLEGSPKETSKLVI